MMHTHMLSPVNFQQDLSASINFDKLVGRIEFPLLKLVDRLENITEINVGDMNRWTGKYPNIPMI